MTLRVHFRGVGVYVANNPDGRITEVLFPNTDATPQDGADDGTEVDPNDPKKKRKKYKHADGSPTVQHFPGAILRAKDGTETPFDLKNAAVVRADLAGTTAGAIMDSAFPTLIPPLDEIVIPFKKLRLLKSRDDGTRVTTRFFLAGRDEKEINTVEPTASSHHDWFVASLNGARGAQSYRLEGLWTIEAKEVEFDVFDLGQTSSGTLRDKITLNEKWPDLYVFNFDEEKPNVDRLTAVRNARVGDVDHDFKWSYQLFQKKDPDWHKWLIVDTNPFPAPILTARRSFKGNSDRLPSVSTCFQVVWTGDDET